MKEWEGNLNYHPGEIVCDLISIKWIAFKTKTSDLFSGVSET